MLQGARSALLASEKRASTSKALGFFHSGKSPPAVGGQPGAVGPGSIAAPAAGRGEPGAGGAGGQQESPAWQLSGLGAAESERARSVLQSPVAACSSRPD